MDPWLEEDWGDIHHSLIQYCRDQIAGQLPGDLFAAVETPRGLNCSAMLDGEDVVPGFTMPVADLFLNLPQE